MLSHLKATPAAARPARRSLPFSCLSIAATLVAATALAACQPRTVALSGADPADPSARVAPVRTSAVIAPYTSLRPAAPTGWGRSSAPRSEPSR
ncbi:MULTISPECIES: hypothetical protein [unclassified Bradyrhizobium]|uniref:hypothetical protein n=1 Tax=unclassified Bradyrhizobium TaxID=2631580 RepID=UPI0028EE48B4|nr:MULTISPECIES: hypothetical protein [unclassified Bradyrhizobium]